MAEMAGSEKEELQHRWNYLYHEYLPSLASAKDSSQKRWPVSLDHCFARIILDNAIGKDKPWTEVLKAPAIKNMSVDELKGAIALAERIVNGEASLTDLDERSLQLRGKQSKQNRKRKTLDDSSTSFNAVDLTKKTKKSTSSATVSSYFLPSPKSPKMDTKENRLKSTEDPPIKEDPSPAIDLSIQLQRIQNSSITDFRKQTLTLLCQIPAGRYSTYGAMAEHISKTSHKTCARAVGSAMRNNPFAPEVPCHRILAGDGSLGGFKGDWGEQGKFARQKRELLHREGVRFDSAGKVRGPPFRDFI